jgi:Domain of unknown function (DUF1127)
MNRLLTWPVIAALSRMIDQGTGLAFRANRNRSPRELPDHILKDIGISRSEILSLTSHGGRDRSRRQRA